MRKTILFAFILVSSHGTAYGEKKIWPCANNGPSFSDEAEARRIAIGGGKAWANQADAFYCLSKGRIFDDQLTQAAAKLLSISHSHGDLVRSRALQYLIEASADPKKIRDIIVKLSNFNDINTERESCRLIATLACFDCESLAILKSWTSHSKASISRTAKEIYELMPIRCQVGRNWRFVRQPTKCS